MIARPICATRQREPQLANDVADRLVIDQKRPPEPANSFHRHLSRPCSQIQPEGAFNDLPSGPYSTRSTPKPSYSFALFSTKRY
jgi:hypothetical protein